MTTNNVEILRKALAAAGHDQALALTNAILPPSSEPEIDPATATNVLERANAPALSPSQVADHELTIEHVKAMSPAEVNTRWDAVAKVMQQGPA